MDRFIVGSGRCGSTLLSRMLSHHPKLLSLFEFFTGLEIDKRFLPGRLAGSDLVDFLGAEQPVVTAVMKRGYPVSEVVYPFDDPASRFRLGDPVPWLLVTLLPRITDQPDRLFDEVLEHLAGREEQTRAEHYRGLFDWLCQRLGRDVWVERSGSSIDYLAGLVELFPEARFVHLHRDGREVALSMREHHAYRLPISLMYDAPLHDGSRVSELGAIDINAVPDPGDPISRILASRPPPEYFGRYWNDQILRGFEAAKGLASDRYLEVAFEALVRDPEAALRQISEFLEIDSDGDWSWIEAAAALVRGVPPTRFESLSASEQRALEEACASGTRLLGRAS